MALLKDPDLRGIEGSALARTPYLSHAGTSFVRIQWRTRKFTRSSITLTASGRVFESIGYQHRHEIDGLVANTTYAYTIAVMGVTLFSSSFKTFPASGLIKFIIVGDTGVGISSVPQMQMARLIEARNPDFLLHTGDVIYPNGERANYMPHYFCQYGPTIARRPWYHVLSAHDYATDRGIPHWENFDKPNTVTPGVVPDQKNYVVSVANIDLFMLDVFDPDFTEDGHARADTTWLAAALAASTAQWKIAVHDVPIYTPATTHGSDLDLRAQLDPLFVAGHVDISFCGYNHLYHRSTPIANNLVVAEGAGPRYITTGGGGQSLYPTGPPEAWTAFQASTWHYIYAEITGASAVVGVFDNTDAAIDGWVAAT